MPNFYITKSGEVHHYKLNPNRDHGGGGGPGPNLTLRIPDDLVEPVADVAKQLGMVRSRGHKAGEGSISQLATAIGTAAQRLGVTETARRLKFLVPKA